MAATTSLVNIARAMSALVIAVGLAVSGYLLLRTFSLAAENDNGADVCGAMFGVDCDATLLDPLSHLLGISLAGWGVVWFGGLATLLAIGRWLGASFFSDASFAAGVVSVASALFSSLLAFVMLLGYAPLCPLCMIVHSVNFVLPVLLLLCAGPVRLWPSRISAAIRFAIGRDAEDPASGKWKAVGFFTSALAALAIYQGVMIQESLQRARLQGESLPLQTLLDFERAEAHEIPIDDAPQSPGADRQLTLVIFSDFRCPSCRRFSKTLTDLRREFGPKLTIDFKHFPLDSTCNSTLNSDLHPGACRLAAAAEAANRQGRFWELHDFLFQTSKPLNDEQLRAAASALGMDVRAFEADRQADETRLRIAADVELGKELAVEATPTLFLNGRRINAVRGETLRGLIAFEFVRTARRQPFLAHDDAKREEVSH